MNEPTILAIPFFTLTMIIEALVLWRQGRAYGARDTAASLSGGVGSLVVKGLTRGLMLVAFGWLYEHRVLDLGDHALAWLWLVPCEDLCFYAYHRASHEIRILWATHVVHHSSTRYTLATALRQSWTAPALAVPFWAPLALLGFRPEQILLMTSFSLLYQYGIHTETVGRLGPLEWVFNTPSHHRVHHGKNPEYLDKNHGGIFILWDRLFGTFEPERAPAVFGITKDPGTYNPITIQFHEFGDIARDVATADGWAARAVAIFGRPGAFVKSRAGRAGY